MRAVLLVALTRVVEGGGGAPRLRLRGAGNSLHEIGSVGHRVQYDDVTRPELGVRLANGLDEFQGKNVDWHARRG